MSTTRSDPISASNVSREPGATSARTDSAEGVSLLFHRKLPPPREDSRVFDRFVATAQRHSQSRAIVCGSASFSYGELERASVRLAARLISVSAKNDRVVIYSRRRPELVLAMLACVRGGLAFAVLDPAYPWERTRRLLDEVQPGRAIVVPQDLPPSLATPQGWPGTSQLFELPDWPNPNTDDAAETESAIDQSSASAPAYVLFTSGTTGQPKGVVADHAPLVHFISWYERRFAVSSNSRFSLLSGVAHDPVLRDIFVPLSLGAELHIPDDSFVTDPDALRDWIDRSGVTHVHATPQLCRVVASARRATPLSSLRFVFCGGDLLTRAVAEEIQNWAPFARVVNLYGTTETPQAMAFHVFDVEADLTDPIPIGRAIADVELMVIDEQNRLCPSGVPGEIAIRTRYLSAGYLNDPELTDRKFQSNPDDSEDRVYLTGDFGHLCDDGTIVFTGRRDDQVKIRGYRVELGEIARCAEQHSAVDRCVVSAVRAATGEARLVAHWVGPDASNPKRADAVSREITSTLRATLPNYMVPSSVVAIPTLPLLPNGKLDRRRLLEPETAETVPLGAEPVGDLEVAIAEAWKRSLGLKAIRADSTFIDLGGDSISFIQTSSQLERMLGWLPAQWERLSIRQLAAQRRAVRARLAQVDTSVLARAALITMVVVEHLYPEATSDCTQALFVISGVSFGRYMLPAVLRTERLTSMWRAIARIAVPTIAFTLMLELRFTSPKWQALLLVSNYVGPGFDHGFTFWFIEVLVQNLLILSSILGVTKIRAVIRRDPFRFALCGTAASLALSLLVPLVWNTEYLFNRVPQHMLGLVFLGCAIALADNGRRKVVVAGVAVAMFTIRTCAGLSPEWLPFATVLFLLWRRFVPLSRAMAAAVNVCAAASLFIYLTYGQVHSIANKTALAGQTWTHVALALLVGSAVWWLWERALDSPLRWLRWQTSAQTLPSDAAR